MDLVLPEQGPLQILAASLQARFRIDVAGRYYDDAVRDIKTMFGFARHLSEHPTEVASRGGLAVANLALDTMEEMLQQPGCPNLYWPLSYLPCPLVDLRKGVEGHRALIAAELRRLEPRPMNDEELDRVISRLSGAIGLAREQAGQPPRGLRGRLAERAGDAERVRAARARLVAALYAEATGQGPPRAPTSELFAKGWETVQAATKLDKLSPLQVILLDEKRAYEARRDERTRLLALAPWQIDKLADAHKAPGGEELFADLLPPVLEARRAQARLEQRIALLRHVEALRRYAAEHDGKLPAKLSDMSVPLPDDPFTGKPFVYKLDGAVAKVCGEGRALEVELTIGK